MISVCTVLRSVFLWAFGELLTLPQIRGTLKSWTKMWCVLKPGVLLVYKSPKVDHWVGTILLNACKLIERPSKKDGFCFKLYHPLDQSIWAVKVRHLNPIPQVSHMFLQTITKLVA